MTIIIPSDEGPKASSKASKGMDPTQEDELASSEPGDVYFLTYLKISQAHSDGYTRGDVRHYYKHPSKET